MQSISSTVYLCIESTRASISSVLIPNANFCPLPRDLFIMPIKNKSHVSRYKVHDGLRPLSKQTHQHQASHETKTSQDDSNDGSISKLCRVPVRADHPVSSPHLDEANPDKDTSGEGIEGTNGDDGRLVVAVKVLQNTDTDSHSDGGDEGEEGGESELLLHGEADRGGKILFGRGWLR